MAVISFAAHCADIFCLVADDRLTANRIEIRAQDVGIAKLLIAERIHARKHNSNRRRRHPILQKLRLFEILARRPTFER